MRAALIASMVLLGGCACEPDPDWNGDERFTPEERAQIEQGAEWLYGQAGLARPHIAWDYRVTGPERLPHTLRRERGPRQDAAGMCIDGMLYLDPVPRAEELPVPGTLPGLAAHELAHCVLGFKDGYHQNAGETRTDGIMRVLAPMQWTEAEREQCRASSVCRPDAS